MVDDLFPDQGRGPAPNEDGMTEQEFRRSLQTQLKGTGVLGTIKVDLTFLVKHVTHTHMHKHKHTHTHTHTRAHTYTHAHTHSHTHTHIHTHIHTYSHTMCRASCALNSWLSCSATAW